MYLSFITWNSYFVSIGASVILSRFIIKYLILDGLFGHCSRFGVHLIQSRVVLLILSRMYKSLSCFFIKQGRKIRWYGFFGISTSCARYRGHWDYGLFTWVIKNCLNLYCDSEIESEIFVVSRRHDPIILWWIMAQSQRLEIFERSNYR